MLNSHPRAAGPRRRFAATLAATLGATLLLGACEGGRGAPDPASRDLSPAAQEPVAESPRAGTPPGAAGVMAPVYALANRCWQLGAGEQAITPQGGGYALATPEAEAALYLRPTGLGSYVLRDTQGGYLTLSGRRTDLIVTGGVNVYPAEVERVLLAHPSVAEGVVFGVTDDAWGQRVTAAVVPRRGAAADGEEIRTFLRARLAGFQTPKDVLVLDDLPRTASGKPLRNVLAERLSPRPQKRH